MNDIFIDILPQYVTSLQISFTDTSKTISATITGFEVNNPNELAWAIFPASYTIIQGIFFTQLAPTSTENSITIYYAVAQNVLLADIRFYLRGSTSGNTWNLIIPEVKTLSSATFNNLMSGTDYSGLLGWSINNGPKEVIPGILITDAVATSTTEPSSTVNSSSTTTANDSSSTTVYDSSTTTNNSSTTVNDSSTTTNDSSTTNNLSPESIAFLRSTSESITFNYVVAIGSEVTFAVSGESPSVTSITISETQTIKTISVTLSGLPVNKSQSGKINWIIDNGEPSVIEGNFGTQQAPTTIANSITIYYAVAQNVSTANIYFYLRENTSSNNWNQIFPVVKTTSSATFNLQSETDYSGLLGWRIKIGPTTVGPIEVIPGSLITDAAATSSTTESSTTENFIPANFFVPHNFFIPHIAPDPILSLWHAWGVCREEDLRDPNLPSTIYFLVTKLVVSGNGYQIITANCLLKQYKIFPPDQSPPLDLSQIDLGLELDPMERLVFETTLINQTTIYPICWTIFASKDANDLILAKDSLGNNYPSPLIGVQPPAPFESVLVNCLLKGTKVKTPYGFSLIENIKEGDIVLNQHGYLTKVIKTISWGIKWADIDKDESNKVYKIAAGKHGCNETVYISHWHQILINGRLICAKDAGLPLATEAEVGSEFTYYHICLEDYERNHLVVNGNCVVESWSGQTPKRIPKLQIPIITSVKKTAILKHFTPKFLTSAKKIF